ncbi:hypothetical protein LEMLEM_LOCUS10915 [Lemmus lemmus]
MAVCPFTQHRGSLSSRRGGAVPQTESWTPKIPDLRMCTMSISDSEGGVGPHCRFSWKTNILWPELMRSSEAPLGIMRTLCGGQRNCCSSIFQIQTTTRIINKICGIYRAHLGKASQWEDIVVSLPNLEPFAF